MTTPAATLSATPFSPDTLRQLAHTHGTPLWVYDADTIVARIEQLKCFDTIRFAQKANSNTHLLRLMREHGVVVDAVSSGEIQRALAAGYTAAPNAQGPGPLPSISRQARSMMEAACSSQPCSLITSSRQWGRETGGFP